MWLLNIWIHESVPEGGSTYGLQCKHRFVFTKRSRPWDGGCNIWTQISINQLMSWNLTWLIPYFRVILMQLLLTYTSTKVYKKNGAYKLELARSTRKATLTDVTFSWKQVFFDETTSAKQSTRRHQKLSFEEVADRWTFDIILQRLFSVMDRWYKSDNAILTNTTLTGNILFKKSAVYQRPQNS